LASGELSGLAITEICYEIGALTSFSPAVYRRPGCRSCGVFDLLAFIVLGAGGFCRSHAKLPLDTDNDLIIVNDSLTPAIGEITHLTGRILSSSGEPLRNAYVEIWQVDSNGIYLNSHDRNQDNRDKNFQGYGRFLTASDGSYYFRTIKPVHYTGRTAHIHFGISKNGRRVYTTQLFIKGNAENERDGVFNGIRDQKAKDSVLIDFQPVADSKIGELSAKFDIVMGLTPEDVKKDDDDKIKGGIGKSEMQQGGGRGFGPPGPGGGFGGPGGPPGRGPGMGPGGPGPDGGPPPDFGPGGFGPPPDGNR
jgi:protocatechuate 3,4-dioxygenase, beta subunit